MARVRELDALTCARDLYGTQLRQHRVRANMSLDRLAHIVNYSKTQLHGVENAERLPLPPLSEKLDAAFGTGELFQGLWSVIQRERFADRYRRLMEIEAQAVTIQTFAAHAVYGLLQTEEYARALLRAGSPRDTPEEVERKLAARLERQQRLRSSQAPDLWVILDEAVIRRPVGGAEVMRRQLDHLLAMAELPSVVLQVIPFSAEEHAVMGGSLTLFTLAGGRQEAAYMEGSHRGHLEEDAEAVRDLRLSYDLVKASALSPKDSATLIASVR